MLARVFARKGARCERCLATTHLSIDHITPLSRGGTDKLSNLRVLCTRCNAKKGNRT
ncbi:MAG: HNH endonuclease [Candidatus Woesearchaeota archaeon]